MNEFYVSCNMQQLRVSMNELYQQQNRMESVHPGPKKQKKKCVGGGQQTIPVNTGVKTDGVSLNLEKKQPVADGKNRRSVPHFDIFQ